MKISIVGAGNVGATIGNLILAKGLANELVLLDIKDGITMGKALDLQHSSAIEGFETKIIGAVDDYSEIADSEIIVIAAGKTRQPQMSRDDLISTNAIIIKEITQNIIKHSPKAKIIVVSNPLDIMTYVSFLSSQGKPSNEIFGMGGILDSARYKTLIAKELNISTNCINTIILGGHGDTMVPLPRFTTIGSIPISHFLSEAKLDDIIKKTKRGSSELFSLMGKSAWYAPASAVVRMIESIVRDSKCVLLLCAYLNGEYGVKDMYMGVPVVLGKNGIESIIEIDLNDQEHEMLMKSARAIKSLSIVLKKMKIV